MNQNTEPTGPPSISGLYHHLKAFRVIKDPAYRHLDTGRFFEDSCGILPVSVNFRRQVYTVQTGFGDFFLKFSPVGRKKDRLRFLFLPWRVTTEWRNLSRLRKKAVAAPQRILFGYQGRFPNRGFFIITGAVRGAAIDCRDPDQVLKMASHLALLHASGIFHRDIHPENMLIDDNGRLVLLDAQEIYFLPWLPHRLKVANLGQLWWHLRGRSPLPVTLEDFLRAYNQGRNKPIPVKAVEKAAASRQEKYYRSRTERCCKNSTDFQVVKNAGSVRGFKRRDFPWGETELLDALARGIDIKDNKLIACDNVCIKIHNRRPCHKDRSLAGWKMARALSVRGIAVPAALAYFASRRTTYFVSAFHGDGRDLNDYFSDDVRNSEKKAAIKQFADWLRTCHDLNVWQRDFKSSNVLIVGNQFMMVDLDGVRIRRRLPWRKKLINLAQLNASLSNRLTVKDRLRFFHHYCRGVLPARKERRRMYQKIWAITRRKNTLPFDLDLEKLTLTAYKNPQPGK